MGGKSTKLRDPYFTSPKASRASTLVRKAVSLSESNVHEVVCLKQPDINYTLPRSKEKKKMSKTPKRSDWSMLIKQHCKDVSWVYPFPWDTSIRLPPEDFFIQLSMAEMDCTGQVDLGYAIEHEHLFDSDHDGADRPEHILIRGHAGFGKSTLCTKIAHDWARNILTFSAFPPDESLVLMYRLRDLPPHSDLEEELRSFAHGYYSGKDSTITSMQKAFRNYGNKLLVILDGYDEISPEHQKQVRDFLSCKDHNSHSFFKMASVILTSRPDTDKDLLYLFDKHFRLTGLSEERRLKLVSSFLRHNTGCANSVLAALNSHEDPCTKNLSPLLVLMICYIAKQEGFDSTMNTEQLPLYCIELMAKRCNERETLNLSEDDISLKLHELGRFFYKCLSNNTLFFRARDMKAVLGDHYDFVLQFGILRNSFQTDEENNKQVFEPIHKQFMEALAKNYLLHVWSTCSPEERLNFVNDFVDSLSAEVFLIPGENSEYLIRIIAKDRMHKENRIMYMWEIHPETGEAILSFEQSSSLLIDLNIRVTTNDPFEGDMEFFINYLTNAFSGVSSLSKCLSFLSLFKQHIHRVKFCRVVGRNTRPNEHKVNTTVNGLENYIESDESVLYLPWSSLTDKIRVVEVELGEALVKTNNLTFVCERLLGFQVDSISTELNAKDAFLNLFRSLRNFHDRFYIKCELKCAVGSKMYRMTSNRKKKVHLITFQCNYKHEHTHPMEVEVDGDDSVVPSFDWTNIHSVILHFSK